MLKNVIDGKLKLKGKCQHLQVKNQNIQKNSQKIPSRKNSSGEGKNSVQNFSSKVIQENPVQKNKNLDQNFCNPVLPPFPDQKLKKPSGIDPFKFSTLTHIPVPTSIKSKKESFPSSIEKLLLIQEQMHKPKFRFDVSVENAKFNFKLLKENNFDL